MPFEEDQFAIHQKRLFLYISSMLPGATEAEEVLQETNLVIWKKMDTFDPESDFISWAFRIAYFQVLAHRKKMARSKLSFDNQLLEQLTETAIEENDLLERRQTFLNACLKKLTEIDRELIEQCYAPGVDVKSFSENMGRKATSVYRSLRRIRQLLNDCVQLQMDKAGQ